MLPSELLPSLLPGRAAAEAQSFYVPKAQQILNSLCYRTNTTEEKKAFLMFQEQTTITVFETSWQTGPKCQMCVFALYNTVQQHRRVLREQIQYFLKGRAGYTTSWTSTLSSPNTSLLQREWQAATPSSFLPGRSMYMFDNLPKHWYLLSYKSLNAFVTATNTSLCTCLHLMTVFECSNQKSST